MSDVRTAQLEQLERAAEHFMALVLEAHRREAAVWTAFARGIAKAWESSTGEDTR